MKEDMSLKEMEELLLHPTLANWVDHMKLVVICRVCLDYPELTDGERKSMLFSNYFEVK